MIPLLDVIFLLITFFIYVFVSMTMHRGLPVALPEASSAPLDPKDYLALTVDRQGAISLNKAPVPAGGLAAALAPWKAKGLEVYLAADRDARHRDVVGALDVLRAEGFTKVSIETAPAADAEGALP